MANIIQQLNKPTLVIAHNKTLAAQLYGEFKEFFPKNAVSILCPTRERTLWVYYLVVFCVVYTRYCGLYGLYGADKTG